MSEITKTAVYSTLSGSVALKALLGVDEDSNPAIFNSFMNRISGTTVPPLPCVTFRESPGSADLRFKSETVNIEYWDFEAWARTESGLVIPGILSAIDNLLHNQTITLTSGKAFDCARMSQTPDLYDDRLKLNFGLARYRLVVSESS